MWREMGSVQGHGQVLVLGGDGEGRGGGAVGGEDAGEFGQGQGRGVAFLAEVGQDQVAERAGGAGGENLGDGCGGLEVGEVAVVAGDAADEAGRAAAGGQEIGIVIGFQDEDVGLTKNAADFGSDVAEVGGGGDAERGGAGSGAKGEVKAEGEAFGVVGEFEGSDVEAVDVEAARRERANQAGAVEAAEDGAEAAAQDDEVFGGGDERDFIVVAELERGVGDVVAVGVGDEEGGDAGGVDGLGGEVGGESALGEAHVDEDSGAGIGDEEAVAATAGTENDETARHGEIIRQGNGGNKLKKVVSG